jgi:hypothetical protein
MSTTPVQARVMVSWLVSSSRSMTSRKSSTRVFLPGTLGAGGFLAAGLPAERRRRNAAREREGPDA